MTLKPFATLFIIMWVFNTHAQSTLDIIRASNFYSKAIGSYQSGSYSSALAHLKSAETNLKGKTNKDLEFLKIMTHYRLGNYKTAYNLVQVYFEKGYSDRTQYFKNVETYARKYDISYDKKLTDIFVELEGKYNVVTNTSVEDVIAKIVQKVKNEKRSVKSVLFNNAKNSVKIYKTTLKPTNYFDKTGNEYTMGYALNGKTVGYDVCAVYPKFIESIKVYENYYSYQLIPIKKHSAFAECYKKLGSYFISAAKYHAERGLFVNSNALKKNYIYFDSEAKILFEQPENLNKLKEALRKANLYH